MIYWIVHCECSVYLADFVQLAVCEDVMTLPDCGYLPRFIQLMLQLFQVKCHIRARSIKSFCLSFVCELCDVCDTPVLSLARCLISCGVCMNVPFCSMQTMQFTYDHLIVSDTRHVTFIVDVFLHRTDSLFRHVSIYHIRTADALRLPTERAGEL